MNSLKKSVKIARIMIPTLIKSRFKVFPLWTHLYVTRKCNLSCGYCFVKDNTRQDLDEEQMKKIIDHLHFLGCRFISFLGGEPTLRNDFINLVQYASQKGMVTHMSTNGTLLTSQYIERLCEAGIDIINLSIDSIFDHSSRKDILRNKKVLDNLIEMRKKYGFKITTNMVLTSRNIGNTLQTIRAISTLRIPISI